MPGMEQVLFWSQHLIKFLLLLVRHLLLLAMHLLLLAWHLLLVASFSYSNPQLITSHLTAQLTKQVWKNGAHHEKPMQEVDAWETSAALDIFTVSSLINWKPNSCKDLNERDRKGSQTKSSKQQRVETCQKQVQVVNDMQQTSYRRHPSKGATRGSWPYY